ncbi:hypothetical protein Plhal304r1_c031g0100821 [Plasmopara halstedii]
MSSFLFSSDNPGYHHRGPEILRGGPVDFTLILLVRPTLTLEHLHQHVVSSRYYVDLILVFSGRLLCFESSRCH